MRAFRFPLITALAVAALGVLAPMALGGGWAVTTIDPIEQALVPGSSVEIGYTIRQHGEKPVDLANTGIAIASAGEPSTFYPGRRSGAVGHYVATVTVPPPGAEWTARQDWFGAQELGDLVTASTAPAAVQTAQPSTTPPVAPPAGSGERPWLLLGATVLTLAVLAVQLTRWRPRPVVDGT